MTEKEKRDFLRDLLELRNNMKRIKKKKVLSEKDLDVRIKNRLLYKLHMKIEKFQEGGVLPQIDIPEVMHTEEHGDLVFRIDHENGGIRILKRIYLNIMDFKKLATKAKNILDNDEDAIIETDIEGGRLLICRYSLGGDNDDYRVTLEKQIEYETEDGYTDEECEQILDDASDLDSITAIVSSYLEEGGREESILNAT